MKLANCKLNYLSAGFGHSIRSTISGAGVASI